MVIYKNVRISVFSDTLFRVEFQPDADFEDNPTLFMGKTVPEEIKYEVEAEEKFLRIKTKKCELYYEKTGIDFTKDILEVRYNYSGETRLWNRSVNHTKPLPEVTRSLDEWSHEIKFYPLPIIINNDGWAKIEENNQVYWDKTKEWVAVKKKPYYTNYYLFFYGNEVETAFKDYINIFGKSPLIPRQAFGSWYSRWYDYKDTELEKLLQDYRENDIPLDVLVIDVDWHTSHWNGYDWRKKSFSNPAKFIKKRKEEGLKLVLNDHPGYEMFDPLPEDDSHLKKLKESIKEPPYKGMWACDWSRKSIVKKWAKYCLLDLLKQEIDWWWIDGWGDYPFQGVDGQFWLNWQYYEITKKHLSKKRALILSRWGGVGSHRYPVQFSGDTHSTFENLKKQIYYTAYSGGLGAYYWSHDIGGFHEGQIDEEVYIRWVQFGVFSPIFRTHSNHGIREPFNFSDTALNIYKKYLYLRYKLIPYIEQLHFNNYLTGFPLLYPMNFVYLNNENADKFTDQYFFGKSILAAPVADPVNNHYKTAKKGIWLPEGWWYDLIEQKFIQGNEIQTKYITLDNMPLFIRSGSIIPSTSLNYPIEEGCYKNITFNLIGLNQFAKEIFYFDDGISDHNFDNKKLSKIIIEYNYKDGILNLNISYDNEYSTDYLPEKIKVSILSNQYHEKTFLNSEEIILENNYSELLSDISKIAVKEYAINFNKLVDN